MVCDTTSRRSRLTIAVSFFLFAVACSAGPRPRPADRVSLGRLTPAPTGYPEEYPEFKVHQANQFQIGALDPTLAPMRPSTPPLPTKETRAIQRTILPPANRPAPEPAAPVITPPLQSPVLDTAPMTPEDKRHEEENWVAPPRAVPERGPSS
jgi:hypothetical protein